MKYAPLWLKALTTLIIVMFIATITLMTLSVVSWWFAIAFVLFGESLVLLLGIILIWVADFN